MEEKSYCMDFDYAESEEVDTFYIIEGIFFTSTSLVCVEKGVEWTSTELFDLHEQGIMRAPYKPNQDVGAYPT